jgi:hypothetical protein
MNLLNFTEENSKFGGDFSGIKLLSDLLETDPNPINSPAV